jgi:hypothetical protein
MTVSNHIGYAVGTGLPAPIAVSGTEVAQP